jgi:DNA polymerase III delta prime subunit
MQSKALMWVSRLPHPIAAMLFCGPTGVGKTELNKALAKHYFGSVSIWYSCKIWLGLSFLCQIPIFSLIGCCDSNVKSLFQIGPDLLLWTQYDVSNFWEYVVVSFSLVLKSLCGMAGKGYDVIGRASEDMERHSVSKLIVSPPGYVGYGDGGALTEAVH